MRLLSIFNGSQHNKIRRVIALLMYLEHHLYITSTTNIFTNQTSSEHTNMHAWSHILIWFHLYLGTVEDQEIVYVIETKTLKEKYYQKYSFIIKSFRKSHQRGIFLLKNINVNCFNKTSTMNFSIRKNYHW